MKYKFASMSAALLFTLMACGSDPASESAAEQGPEDVEGAYYALSLDAQQEVAGVQLLSREEMRKELLAKADTDGDGQLSKAEKDELRAQWQEIKAQIKAEMKAKFDQDDDGEVSDKEVKEGLDNMGQKIKAAIEAKHEEIRAAQQATKDAIDEACADSRGSEECRASAKAEREKLHETIKASVEDLQAEIDELKTMLKEVETRNATI